jgi:hypothetical protein
MAKQISFKSPKYQMCSIIESEYHNRDRGDFSHYAVFLPHGKDTGWREKVLIRNE